MAFCSQKNRRIFEKMGVGRMVDIKKYFHETRLYSNHLKGSSVIPR
jgi:hypothetical protein